MSTIWTVTAEFESADDAVALKELAAELGVGVTITSRTIGGKRTPPSRTRLGRLVLRKMADMQQGRTVDLETVAGWLTADDYEAASAGSIMSLLTAEGAVERVDRGLYRMPREVA